MSELPCFWWRLKVFDPESNTTTTLDRYGSDLQELIKDVEDEEGGWVFVSAYLSKNQ